MITPPHGIPALTVAHDRVVLSNTKLLLWLAGLVSTALLGVGAWMISNVQGAVSEVAVIKADATEFKRRLDETVRLLKDDIHEIKGQLRDAGSLVDRRLTRMEDKLDRLIERKP